MTVWPLKGGYSFEGSDVIGIFSSQELALEQQQKVEDATVYQFTSVYPVTIDSYKFNI